MTRIWVEEQAFKGRNKWTAFWAYVDYNKALQKAREDNREERKRGHIIRYRITDLIVEENIKVVK